MIRRQQFLGIRDVSGTAHGVDALAHASLANDAGYAEMFTAIVKIPSVLAEGWLAGLLVKGGKHEGESTRVPLVFFQNNEGVTFAAMQ